jgi:signal transduction histidine kinase/CHASE3 domain sensor protein
MGLRPEEWGKRLAVTGHRIAQGGAVLLLTFAALVGFRLIDAAGRAPAAVETALRVQTRAGTVLRIVADLESDRRGFQLTGMAEHFAALRLDHERVHDALRELREVVTSPGLAGHVDSAEAAIGFWSDEVAAPMLARQAGQRSLARDKELLGGARRHLGAVVSAAERDALAARLEIWRARARARGLWLLVTGVTLLSIVALAELAHRRHQRLLDTSREIELLLSALPFALVSLDPDGVVRHATGRAQTLFGVPVRRLVGRRLAETVNGTDRHEVESGIAQALGGARVDREAIVSAEFEAPRVLSLTLAPIREAGVTVGVSVVVRDATAERALKTQALHADRLASVGTLASSVARELGGRLASISRLAASADAAQPDREALVALAGISSEAARAARLVGNLRDFSRQRAHRHEPTDLRSVLQRALSLRRYDPRSRHVDFVVDLASDLPPVVADASELQQAFLQLIVNAEYAVRDQPTCRVTVRAERAGELARVSVEDTGAGIPEDQLETVFEPFYTTKPPGEATGLGLALARGVVTEHGGRIWAERSPGGGARFLVLLPVVSAAEPNGRNSVPALAALSLAVVAMALGGCSDGAPENGARTTLQLAAISQLPPEVQRAPVAVSEAYRFAVANPAILRQVPCYCGCGAMGHTSNAACYLAPGSRDGAPVFDGHALGCSICVDITHDVMRLMRQGKALAEIRAYVDTTYARYGPSNLR